MKSLILALCLSTFSLQAQDIALRLEELGYDPLHTTNRGDTLLHQAVRKSNPEVVSLALSYGFDPNRPNKAGDTPLHIAAEKGDLRLCQLLLAAGADREAQNNLGQTPYHCALRQKHTIILDDLGNVESASFDDYLIAEGWQPDHTDKAGNTLWHRAVKEGNPFLIEKLLDEPRYCKLLAQRNKQGESPLTLAIRQKDVPVFSLILDYSVLTELEITLAAKLGWCEGLSAMLDRTAYDINQLVWRGPMALNLFHDAVYSGNVKCVAMLIERGADVNKVTGSQYRDAVWESDTWSSSDWGAYAEFSNEPPRIIKRAGYLYPLLSPLAIAYHFHPQNEALHELLISYDAEMHCTPSITGEGPKSLFTKT